MLAGQIAVLCVFAVARLTTRVPVSGHVMLALFYVIESGRWAGSIRYLVLGGWACLWWFTAVKFFAWGDFATPLTGAAVGLLVGYAPLFLDREVSS